MPITVRCESSKLNSDDTFENVYKRVKRMKNNPRIANGQSGMSPQVYYEKTLLRSSHILVSYNKHFEVPHLLSPAFTGRDEDLQHLSAVFASGQLSHNRHQRRFVLFGVGGSGKSQICLKYMQMYRERYWGIFCVDASTDDRIQQCFAQIACLLQVDENIDSVKRMLANTPQAWLLLFDNADDQNLSLTPYLPVGNRGDIIITSRNPGCQHYNTVGSQEVGRLSPDDSVSLLTKIVYGGRNPSQQATEEGKKIVEALGCLPLAIVQAGAYICETSCTLQDYLEIYERRQRDLLQFLPKHVGTDYRCPVYMTWQVSVDMIESRHDTVSNHALQFLSLLGFYHHDQIPVQMFYNAWHPSRQGYDRSDYVPGDDTMSDFFDYRQSVQASITLLASFSLIIRNTDASLSLHPLVHEWCRDRMSDEEQKLNYRRALSLLVASVEWKFETEDYIFRRSLVSHVHEFLRLRDHQVELSEEEKMQEWSVLALVLGESGWAGDALQLTEEAVDLHKSKLGKDHPDTLWSMHSLAIRYSVAGRLTEALQLTEEVVNLRKSKLGEDHSDTLMSMHNLANRYSETGRRTEALQLSEEVLKLRKSKLGEDHPDTLRSMHNLAIQYSKAGRRTETLQLAEEVVNLQKSKLGDDHPETLMSMHSLAIWYSEAGRRTEALQLTEEAVNLHKSKLGKDHPDTLWSMHNLAIRYSEAGRRTEALQLSEKVLKLHKSKLDDDHPDTLRSMHNLAIRYSEAGRRTEALQLSEEVLKLRKSKLGEDHPNTLASENLLAHLSQRIDETLSISEAAHRPRHSRFMFLQRLRPGGNKSLWK